MAHSVKINNEACEGCVNCIKICPTEAIRVIDGEISIISELCIDCGECFRSCRRKALGMSQDDWNEMINTSGSAVIADPSFFSQFGSQIAPDTLKEVFKKDNVEILLDDVADAFDLSAYISAQMIETSFKENNPLLSVYCPAVVRLIQSKFPGLLQKIIPVYSPLELAADIWRFRTGSREQLTLLSPCPAKITMVHNPESRDRCPIDYATSIKSIARKLMADGTYKNVDKSHIKKRHNRWLAWAKRGGEARHVQAFAKRKINVLAVSGMRNTIDLLRECELGRLRGVDFIECRVCDTGCIGGVANLESRFRANLTVSEAEVNWEISENDRKRAESLQAMDFWAIKKPYSELTRRPLSDNVADAMIKLRQMKEVYKTLPHLDCGSCGRPSCMAMAEEIVRGHGSPTDCIFKLREGIATLANKIAVLSESQPHPLKKKGKKNESSGHM